MERQLIVTGAAIYVWIVKSWFGPSAILASYGTENREIKYIVKDVSNMQQWWCSHAEAILMLSLHK